MAEPESSPQAAALTRLAELHRQECAPEEFHGRVAQRIAALASAMPQAQTGARRRASRQRLAWVPLLAAAAAIVVWIFAAERSIIPVREVPTRPSIALPVSFSGTAVPGSLRWRQFAAPSGDGTAACEYHFRLQPEGSQPVLRVLWTACEFPASLREVTMRRSSSATDVDVRVFVSGNGSESGELHATELRVLTP